MIPFYRAVPSTKLVAMGAVTVNRRHFLSLLGASAAASALPSQAAPTRHHESFTFLFLTDSHLQPELDATHGTDLAFRRARMIPADFAIQGGDHVFDALSVSKERATQVFDLYGKTEQDLGLKVHHTLGNHDIFGIFPASGVGPADPSYGKKMFEARFGLTYYSFDHKGVHFIVLDSVGITDDRRYIARIGDAQLEWLAKDLAALQPGAPIIVTTHIPLVTAVPSYSVPGRPPSMDDFFVNGPATIKLFEGHNVLAVLQGHTHVNERVEWHGVPYLTGGAICGNWWHGTRFGTPEGFTIVTVSGGKVTTRYEASGFRTIEPQNT